MVFLPSPESLFPFQWNWESGSSPCASLQHMVFLFPLFVARHLKLPRGWKDGSAFKSTWYSFRGTELSAKHLPQMASAPRDLIAFSGLQGALFLMYTCPEQTPLPDINKNKTKDIKSSYQPDVVICAWNSSIWEAETKELPTWATKWVSGHPRCSLKSPLMGEK